MAIQLAPEETNIWRIVQAIIQLVQGRSNAVGEITLRAGHTTTVATRLTHPAVINVSKDSEVFLTPRTANAAAVVASTYISATIQGGFTVTHPSSANTDMTFGFESRGGG